MTNIEQTGLPIAFEHTDVRDLTNGMEIHQSFVVRACEQKEKKDGQPYLVLIIGDRTGSVETVVWQVRDSPYDEVARVAQVAEVGAVLRLKGKVEVHEQYGTRIKLTEEDGRALIKAAAKGEYDPDRLMQGPARPLEAIERDLMALVAFVEDRWLRELLEEFFPSMDSDSDETSEFYLAFREAPAALKVHQAYRHGLIEHTVGLASAVRTVAMAAPFGPVNVDLALTGALLHDVGKVYLYEPKGLAQEMTTPGMLFGEVPVTYRMVHDAIASMVDFPEALGHALLHIVASHHGQIDWGATAVPATREAWLVHCLDVLAARLGAIDRLETTVSASDEWTAYDRSLGSRVWFGPYN
jgi:3'-5' exoribonuclease